MKLGAVKMKDKNDFRTDEIFPVPARRGRRPANGVAAQTPADRQRAYRQRLAAKPPAPSPESLRIAELERQCAALAEEVGRLRADNIRLHAHNVEMANRLNDRANLFAPLRGMLAQEGIL